MMSIPLNRQMIKQQSGISLSWNAIAGHLADLNAEGIVRKLIYARSRPHAVRYTAGKKAGKVETRTKTNAWFQLSGRFKPVEGMNWERAGLGS